MCSFYIPQINGPLSCTRLLWILWYFSPNKESLFFFCWNHTHLMNFSSSDAFSIKHSLIPLIEFSFSLYGSLKASQSCITVVLLTFCCASGPLGILRCRFWFISFEWSWDSAFLISSQWMPMLPGLGPTLRSKVAVCIKGQHLSAFPSLLETASLPVLFQSGLMVIPASHTLPSLVPCWQF